MLYIRECRAIRKNLVYFIFLVIIIIFYITQFNADLNMDIAKYKGNAQGTEYSDGVGPLTPIESYPEDLGFISAEVPEMVMPNAIAVLAMESAENKFTSYPNGFYKETSLSESEQKKINDVIAEITGLSAKDVVDLINDAMEKGKTYPASNAEIVQFGETADYSKIIPIKIDYNTFKKKIEIVDDMLGGGSSYSPGNLYRLGYKQATPEDYIKEYRSLIDDDQITNAYARLYCDYMGIEIALFAVFVPVAFLLRDRRAKMNELIYPRKVSSVKLIGTRYLSVVSMIFIPILIISFVPLIRLAIFASENGLSIDYLAFIKYSFAWLLPTLLATVSVGFFFTILTDTPVGILIQFGWAFFTVFMSNDGLTALAGENKMALVVRFNMVGGFAEVQSQIGALMINRLGYSVFALILLILSIVLYEMKRKGKLDVRSKLAKKINFHKTAA